MYHVIVSESPFVRAVVAWAHTFDDAKRAASVYCASRGFTLYLEDDADYMNCADGLIVKSAWTADVVCVEPVDAADREKAPVEGRAKRVVTNAIAALSPWRA